MELYNNYIITLLKLYKNSNNVIQIYAKIFANLIANLYQNFVIIFCDSSLLFQDFYIMYFENSYVLEQ